MSQHDYIISNDTGANVRSDLNNALGAIATINSGATEPSTTYSYQLWMDTTNNVLKIRNSANSAWYTLPISPVANNTVDINGGTIDGVTIGGSSAGAGTFTNLTATGTASVAGASTFNSGNADVDFTVNGDNGKALLIDGTTNDIAFYEATGTTAKFFWDASAESLGIGTSSPASKLDAAGTIRATNQINPSSGKGLELAYNTSSDIGQILSYDRSGSSWKPLELRSQDIRLQTSGSERMRIDSSGRLLVGKTTDDVGTVGNTLWENGMADHTRDGSLCMRLNRLTSDGDIISFRKDGTTVGSISSDGGNTLKIGSWGTGDGYLKLGSLTNTYVNVYSGGVYPDIDNSIDMGISSRRWDDVYATNGTIQTSDEREKQDIEELSEAEQRVAVAAKGLLRKYRWKDSVAEKGDEARIHFGIIAQDLQAAFEAEGLDAGRYGMFIHSTWWETYTDVPAVEAVEAVYETQTDEEGNEVQVLVSEAVEAKEAYTRTDTHDEPVEGATEKSRMGIRYPELLAFIIAAI